MIINRLESKGGELHDESRASELYNGGTSYASSFSFSNNHCSTYVNKR